MSHMIEQMAYYGEVPWHGLGTRTERAMTAGEALSLGGLDFDVIKVPIFLEGGIEIEDQYAMLRNDRDEENVLGIVGSKYTPLQNVEAFQFFDTFVSRDEAMYHTAGSLKGGRKIWLLAKLPGEIRVLGEDITEKYLLLSNSHDGTSGVQIKFTPIRVVCNNTLTAAIKSGTTYNIRHTSSVTSQVQQASKVLGISNDYYRELEEAFKAMTETKMSPALARNFLELCFEKEVESAANGSTRAFNIMEQVYDTLDNGLGTQIDGVRGTLWGAYNAVTEFVDHRKNYRNIDTQVENVLFSGTGQAIKQRAFDVALELMKA